MTERLKKDIIKLVIDQVVIEGESVKIFATIPLPNKIHEREMDKTDIPGTFNAGATLGPVNETNMTRIWNKRKQTNTPLKRKVFVAMSGGVDSSVAALLLKKKGYDVTGVFMKYWMDENDITAGVENRCCSLEARRDAMRICAQIGIPFLTYDFQEEFKKAVVNEFVSCYKSGRTPNPCVTCNKEIKLGLFLKCALKEGADFVATGHYAKVVKDKKNGFSKLCQAKDAKKDQSYFLYNLNQGYLRHILFPLGDLTKDEVRDIALKAGLAVASKKDSQEVCFVKKGGLKEFLGKRLAVKKGEIISETGDVIGTHEGVQFYTIGQRVPVGGIGPYFVVSKNTKKNQLNVTKGDSDKLFSREMFVGDVNWTHEIKLPEKIKVKIRYQSDFANAIIKKGDGKKEARIVLEKPQKAVTSGQSAVFYKGKEILGGGIIL